MEQPPLTGFAALEYAVSKLDKNVLREKARADIKSGKITRRPPAVKILQVLEGLDKNELEPRDLMISKVPVIPPLYRPFAVVGDTFLPGQANELYRDLIQYKDFHRDLHKDLGDEGTQDTKYNLYKAVRSVYGYDEAINPKTRARGVSGFLGQLLGDGSPKKSVFHRRLFSKTQDSISRGVVTAGPELELDEIGIPKEVAWKVYGPYIQRRLLRSGMSSMSALQNVAERTKNAEKALEVEMKERPVVYSRSPVWWKHGVLAGWPKLTDGDNIQTNPFVSTGLNLDHDGDDQLNIIYLRLPKTNSLKPVEINGLTEVPITDNVISMLNKLQIPLLNPDTDSLFIADMEDFPRTELRNSKTGANGIIDFYDVPQGTRVIALDETTGKPLWADVDFYSVHKARAVEVVDLDSNTQVYTDDDPRAIYGVDPTTGEFTRDTPTNAMHRNILVPIVRDTEQIFSDSGLRTSVGIGELGDFVLDWDLGYVLGVLAGDGWWDKKAYGSSSSKRFYIADLKGFNARKVIDICGSKFSDFSHSIFAMPKEQNATRYGDTVRYSCNFTGSQHFAEFLDRELGGARDENTAGSGNKHIPNFTWQSPRTFREGLLCGLIDTDGTCCVTHGKSKPQLTIAFSSCSIRLCREVVLLCKSLGIRASISFSKVTTANNPAWIVNISSVDCKREQVLQGLQCPWKKAAFTETDVVMDGGSGLRFDRVVFPLPVTDILASGMRCLKITQAHRNAGGQALDDLIRKSTAYVALCNARTDGIITRRAGERILEEVRTQYVERLQLIADAKFILNTPGDTFFTPDLAKTLRDAIMLLGPVGSTMYKPAQAQCSKLNYPLKVGKLTPRVKLGILPFLDNPLHNVLDSPIVQEWRHKYLENRNITWARITGVQKTGILEDGYDLTVPGYETFMSAEGVILSNTMNVSLPSMPESVEEAKERLMPSKMLMSTKSPDTIVPALKHEQVLGSYTAKNTPSTATHKFQTEDEALDALKRGEIRYSDDLEIG